MAEPLSAEERERARGIAVQRGFYGDGDGITQALLDAEAEVARLREALHSIADEGQYLNAGTWHREPALIAALALQENPYGGNG